MAPSRGPELDQQDCRESIRVEQGSDAAYAAWWSRVENRVVLRASVSRDGGVTWSAPLDVDRRDRSVSSCERPAPSIAVDEPSGYVYLSYWLDAVDGAGVWFAHSMDRGAMYHAPVAVAYGGTPGRTAVAGRADTVVVAYEEPNSTGVVSLGLSRTAGHIFEHRERASGSVQAFDPVVAMRGRWIAVGWSATNDTASRTFTVRTARLR